MDKDKILKDLIKYKSTHLLNDTIMTIENFNQSINDIYGEIYKNKLMLYKLMTKLENDQGGDQRGDQKNDQRDDRVNDQEGDQVNDQRNDRVNDQRDDRANDQKNDQKNDQRNDQRNDQSINFGQSINHQSINQPFDHQSINQSNQQNLIQTVSKFI